MQACYLGWRHVHAYRAAADSNKQATVLRWAATSFRSGLLPLQGHRCLHAGLYSAVTEHARRTHLPDVCRQLPHEHLGIQRTPELMLQSICEELRLAATLDDGDRYPLGQLQGAATSLLQMQMERYAERLAGPGDTPAAQAGCHPHTL